MKGHLSQKCQWCRPWGYRKIRGLHDWVDGMGCNEFHYKWPGWWFGTWLWFSISYMGCHPSHWRTHIFQDVFFNHQPVTNEMTERNDWMKRLNERVTEWVNLVSAWLSESLRAPPDSGPHLARYSTSRNNWIFVGNCWNTHTDIDRQMKYRW